MVPIPNFEGKYFVFPIKKNYFFRRNKMNKQKQNKQNNRETSNTETGTSIKTTINFIKQRHPVNNIPFVVFVVNITVDE